MPTFEEWIKTVLVVRLLAERYKDPLLLPLINTLERVGEAFKTEPEYEAVMKILEEARELLNNTTTTTTTIPTVSTINTTSTTSTSGGDVLLEAVVRDGTVTVPADVVRKLGLRRGGAVVRLGFGGNTVEFHTTLQKPGTGATLRFNIPIDITRKLGITDGSTVTVLGITQEWVGFFTVRRRRVVYIPADVVRRLGLRLGPAVVRMGVGRGVVEFRAGLYQGGGGGSMGIKFLIPSDIAQQYGIRPGDSVVIYSIRNLA